jgi:hypothetical protein
MAGVYVSKQKGWKTNQRPAVETCVGLFVSRTAAQTTFPQIHRSRGDRRNPLPSVAFSVQSSELAVLDFLLLRRRDMAEQASSEMAGEVISGDRRGGGGAHRQRRCLS